MGKSKKGKKTGLCIKAGNEHKKSSKEKRLEARVEIQDKSDAILRQEANRGARDKNGDLKQVHTNLADVITCDVTDADIDLLQKEPSALRQMLFPITPEEFFTKYFEKRPLVIKRQQKTSSFSGSAGSGDRDDETGNGNDKKASKFYQRVSSLGQYNRAAIERELMKGTLKYGSEVTLAKFQSADSSGTKMQKVIENVKDDGEIAEIDEVRNALDRFGTSCQLMHPQRFAPEIAHALSALEDEFGCLFGANSYVTPAGYVGFAPHFDDVEVWMLQLEGSKRWRCWTPNSSEIFAAPNPNASGSATPSSTSLSAPGSSASSSTTSSAKTTPTTAELDGQNLSSSLPREFSRDFTLEECATQMTLRLDVVLEEGDLLYIPRGTVHFGESTDESSSPSKKPAEKAAALSSSKNKSNAGNKKKQGDRSGQATPGFSHHLTFSTYQKHSYFDFLNELLPTALQHCRVHSEKFRRGLPPRFYETVGCLQGGPPPELRTKLSELLREVAKAIETQDEVVQKAADQMGSDFVVQRLPPSADLVQDRSSTSLHGADKMELVGDDEDSDQEEEEMEEEEEDKVDDDMVAEDADMFPETDEFLEAPEGEDGDGEEEEMSDAENLDDDDEDVGSSKISKMTAAGLKKRKVMPPSASDGEEGEDDEDSSDDDDEDPDDSSIPLQATSEIRFRPYARRSVRCALDEDPETKESQCLILFPHRNLAELHMCGEARLAEYYANLDAEAAEAAAENSPGDENSSANQPDRDPRGSVRLETLFFPGLRHLMQCAHANKFVRITDLPMEEECDKMALAELLKTLELIDIKPLF